MLFPDTIKLKAEAKCQILYEILTIGCPFVEVLSSLTIAKTEIRTFRFLLTLEILFIHLKNKYRYSLQTLTHPCISDTDSSVHFRHWLIRALQRLRPPCTSDTTSSLHFRHWFFRALQTLIASSTSEMSIFTQFSVWCSFHPLQRLLSSSSRLFAFQFRSQLTHKTGAFADSGGSSVLLRVLLPCNVCRKPTIGCFVCHVLP